MKHLLGFFAQYSGQEVQPEQRGWFSWLFGRGSEAQAGQPTQYLVPRAAEGFPAPRTNSPRSEAGQPMQYLVPRAAEGFPAPRTNSPRSEAGGCVGSLLRLASKDAKLS
ncbi:unnamed protein product [Effrenium voratum]|nr:unnamed protein product [Effrenium voratum]